MQKIALTKGFFAIVDDEDMEMLSQYRWHASISNHKPLLVYASTTLPGGRKVSMHRMLLGEPAGHVDHKNDNGLDNRRFNLRKATPGQNTAHQKNRSKSPYKGIYSRGKVWCASIHQDGRSRHLGTFDSAERAAVAYNVAALEVHGEFARLNATPLWTALKQQMERVS